MPSVFIVNEPRASRGSAPQYDTAPAGMFGDVVYIFENDGPRPGADPSWAVSHAKQILSEKAQPGDFIVWAGGDPMTMVVVASLMADLVDGHINYLAWNRTFKTYTPVPLSLFDGE